MKNFFNNMKNLFNSQSSLPEDDLFPSSEIAENDTFIDDSDIDGALLSSTADNSMSKM